MYYIIDCIDLKRSEYTTKKTGPATINKYSKLVLNEKKIPHETKLFRLHPDVEKKVVHEDVVRECERQGVTGVHFIPLSEYKDI